MKDIIAVIVILIILGIAIGYIVRSKKKGVKCIGCPSGGDCSKCNSCNEKQKGAVKKVPTT